MILVPYLAKYVTSFMQKFTHHESLTHFPSEERMGYKTRWKRENEHLTWWLTELQKHVKAESHDDRSFVDVWGRTGGIESHEAPLSHLNALLIFSFECYGTHLFSFEYTRLTLSKSVGTT